MHFSFVVSKLANLELVKRENDAWNALYLKRYVTCFDTLSRFHSKRCISCVKSRKITFAQLLNLQFYFSNIPWFKSVIFQFSNALSIMSTYFLDPEIIWDNISNVGLLASLFYRFHYIELRIRSIFWETKGCYHARMDMRIFGMETFVRPL